MSFVSKKWLILGNPDNRRVKFFLSALNQSGESSAVVVSYKQFIANPLSLTERLTANTILRIESPGEDSQVEKLLTLIGAKQCPALDLDKFNAQNNDYGEIFYPNLFHSGFKSILNALMSIPSITHYHKFEGPFVLNSVNDITLMFDKSICHSYLQERGINLPGTITGIYSFDELLTAMDEHHYHRVFIKLRHASSASGCIALAINFKTKKMIAYTTIELVDNGDKVRLFNSLKPKIYHDIVSIRRIIDTLAQYGLQIEQWVPKPVLNGGYTYDLRVIVVGQSVKHIVARLSKQPITNLHLGNLRQSISDLPLSENDKLLIKTLAVDVSYCFPDSSYLGVDIALPKNSKPVVIEVNAFGDLLPNLEYMGLNTYETEIAYVQELLK